jgi:diaminohydroxyphosphoribosylaminopyrimidine deaminase/5-amino-6-(5-phosphoribosylamino)uracil reductase
MSFTSIDHDLMARAVTLARLGQFTCRPNPAVGSVIARAGKVIGEGWHRRAGENHAEIEAMNSVSDRALLKGATLYVTLEPCSHTGKTPPCADAVIAAGIGRLVYGMQDPNPEVSGSGIERMQQAGVEIAGPLQEAACEALNPGFIKRMQTGLPLVRLKQAMSLDGRTAMASGESQWITGSAAREDVQHWRARSCAVLTGSGTVMEDDPQLNVRAEEFVSDERFTQPLRVVLDRRGRIGDDRKIFSGEGEVLVSRDHTDIETLLKSLAGRGCNEVLVEAGATLAGALMKENLVDQWIIYMAPSVLGSTAKPLLELPLDSMSEKKNWNIVDLRSVGDDWRILAEPAQGS